MKRDTEPVPNPEEEEFVPRTPLGRELWELRKKIVESGAPLLSREEVEREIADRRGGFAILDEDFKPQTELGELLLKARQEYLSSGEPLLDEDGLEREMAERRGEQS